MIRETPKVHLVRAVVAALCGCAAAFAYAGGNGNGANGSGGSHGAATAGMTYHSEPVSSPWNRIPGDTSRMTTGSDTNMPGMTPDDSSAMTPQASRQVP
ncbi:hypothetical protein [Burkholderia sp. Ac-20365]|jgi:hypothetical protein|uniref:hypothetical protein n=1 Tax=Burkholderia sp. Ac-20365 TaxID=2703897 RepID=UPI00197C0316|nr:hypothetical protein [Burkholderia sp. Ac-20365]MBN3763415.1 hypothetical protein [Burkholderia sp. Ac-20365]